MKHLLLLGAGFSRNWRGWLASEALDYLIGCDPVDADIKELLSGHRDTDGFEGALDELQANFIRNPDGRVKERLQRLQDAIAEMFGTMDQAFASIKFEFKNDTEYLVRTFMTRFDTIFTLNQDLLLERHYLDGNVALSSPRKWDGWQIPGMKRVAGTEVSPFEQNTCKWSPMEPDKWKLSRRTQPYIKLHGSSNWIDGDGGQLLVMGGNKAATIQQHQILRWYFEKFVENLSSGDARLMVIGYSFGDDHINRAILDAISNHRLKLFIIDTAGVKVTDRIRDNAKNAGVTLAHSIVGASTRSLNETFGGDVAEHTKVMRFFR
ncbi:MAG: SIR2 family protein [Dongiaceae bacterium]